MFYDHQSKRFQIFSILMCKTDIHLQKDFDRSEDDDYFTSVFLLGTHHCETRTIQLKHIIKLNVPYNSIACLTTFLQ